MKRTIFPAICILLCTLLITFIPTENDASIYEDTIRLHILAVSDSKEDQAMKFEIRDRVLEKYGPSLKDYQSAEAAKEALYNSTEPIKNDCERWLCEMGYECPVAVSVSEEWYDTRTYSRFTMPAGKYTSLKIELGEAEGQNWWCVMYPPLCLDVATAESLDTSNKNDSNSGNKADGKYSKEENELITMGGYRVKFKLLEVASLLIDKERN